MSFTYEGAPLSVPPKRALANVEARMRRVEEIGGTLSRDLEAERDALQHQADVETIARYETLRSRYMEYRHTRRSWQSRCEGSHPSTAPPCTARADGGMRSTTMPRKRTRTPASAAAKSRAAVPRKGTRNR